MEVRDPRSGEHVHYTNLFDVRRPVSKAVFDPLHRRLVQTHWFIARGSDRGFRPALVGEDRDRAGRFIGWLDVAASNFYD
jgi:hypothetical protein